MAGFTQSGIFYLTWRDIYKNDTAVDVIADTLKGAIFSSAITTPNLSTDTAYGVAPFNANEVSPSAGGVALTTVALSVASSVAILDCDDVVFSGSITNADGMLVYDDTITTPVADPALLIVDFGSAFTVSGTLTVQIPAGGLWRTALVSGSTP